MAIGNFFRKPRAGIVRSMSGIQPAFNAGPVPPINALGKKYDFQDLANYEQAVRTDFGSRASDQILSARNSLATSLNDQGKKFFEMNNPYILEDLNARGVFTSPTAVNQAQANALKEIELGNQAKLSEFDTAALAAKLQGEQDALDASLDLRRGALEARMGESAAAREERLARDLAQQQNRTGIMNSLIGAGGSIAGPLLAMKLMSGGGAAAAGTAAAGTTAAGTPGLLSSGAAAPLAAKLSSAGLASPLGVGAVGAAGLGAMALAKKGEKVGGTAGGIVANPIGYQLNKAKDIIKSPKKAVKKIFCFDGMTLIAMADGSLKRIGELVLGDKTKGGPVESIRISNTEEGTRYSYKGIEVTGSHAVLENGQWIRVEDSIYSTPLNGPGVVWSIVTPTHRVYAGGATFADEHETDRFEELTVDQSLDELNKQQMVEVA